MRPNDRIALVTGALSGIGRATALALAGAGFITYATARQPATVTELGSHRLHLLALDVTDETSMVTAVQTVEAAHGAIGLLVNNAGYSELGPIEEVPLERVRRELETNVFFLETNADQNDGDVLSPEDVARVIVQAVQAEHPEPRYKVGDEAGRITAMRRKLSDREWDEIYRKILG